MATYIPYINPIRFQKIDTTIDYVDVFPSSDNMRLQESYQRGVYPVSYYPDFLINKEISVIVYSNVPAYAISKVIILPDSSTVSATLTDITPAVYSGDYIYKVSYTPTIEGVHYLNINNEYISDPFYVRSSDKDLIQINFYDSDNRYGGYFFDTITQVWNPYAYYTGVIKVGQPEDEQSVYDQSQGNSTILDADPKRIRLLTITDINENYIDIIKQQSICSNYYVNGVRFAAEDLAVNEVDKSDVVDITMKLTQKDNDYNFVY